MHYVGGLFLRLMKLAAGAKSTIPQDLTYTYFGLIGNPMSNSFPICEERLLPTGYHVASLVSPSLPRIRPHSHAGGGSGGHGCGWYRIPMPPSRLEQWGPGFHFASLVSIAVLLLSQFPIDHEIITNRSIWAWIDSLATAQGFLQSPHHPNPSFGIFAIPALLPCHAVHASWSDSVPWSPSAHGRPLSESTWVMPVADTLIQIGVH